MTFSRPNQNDSRRVGDSGGSVAASDAAGGGEKSESTKCRNCAGQGFIHCTAEFGMPCETCDGTGRVVTPQRHVMEAGTRWQHSFEERLLDECPKCNGDGWIDEDNDHGEVCGLCGGKGEQ